MTSDRTPAPGDSAAPAWLVRAAAVGVRLLVLVVLVWLLAELAVKLTLLLVAVLVALLVAGVFGPCVEWTARKGVPRWVASAAGVLLLLGAVVGTTAALGARVADEVPQLREQLQPLSQDLQQRFGVDLPFLQSASATGSSAGGVDVLSSARVAANVLAGFFLSLALAFLFLKDGPRMWGWVLGKLGGAVHDDVDAAGRAAWGTVGSYVRGLTVVALFDAVGIGVGLLLLGVPLALTLAVLQFVASYIPTIGAFVAGALAVVVAYVANGLGTAGLVLLLVIAVQQIGNDVIEPLIMGRELPLSPALVLVAVTAGGLLWGIAGALLFVPLAAAASAAAHELWVRHGSRPIAGG